jgi:NTE family protein
MNRGPGRSVGIVPCGGHPRMGLSGSPAVRWLLCALWLTLLRLPLTCQETAEGPRRPRIGLVLEGGGALGLAHIGVLEWFEEHHIPVDYIAGTSMGALIGGFYATGVKPGEINQLVQNIDWHQILSDETPYRDLSFRRKEDKRAYPNSLEFGIRHGVRFQGGFNAGHQVGLLLDRVTLAYSDLHSFDDLPIPFRCVGTDMVTAEPHIFKDGPLSEALRASMSIPGVFTPVAQNRTVYVDGGLLDNLPVDVMQQMRPDVIIAVHLAIDRFEPNQPLSSISVVADSLSVAVANNEMRSMEMADLLVTVDLRGFSMLDYDKAKAMIQAGYDSARGRTAVLSKFALSEEDWTAYLAHREARRRSPAAPQFVEVKGTSPILARQLEQQLSSYTGKPVDPGSLASGLTRIKGIGRFSSIDYRLTQRGALDGLLVVAHPKDYAPPLVNPLVLIDGTDYDNVRFSLGARITALDVGEYSAEWRNDVIAGSSYGISSEYFFPWHPLSRFFAAPRGFVTNDPEEIYSGTDRIAEYRQVQAGTGFDLGYQFGRSGEFRVGYQVSFLDFTRRIGSPTLKDVSGRSGVSRLEYQLDLRDDPVIPRSGAALTFTTQWYDANPGATDGFPATQLNLTLFQRVSAAGSLLFTASGASAYGSSTGIPLFAVGGPLQLSAYGTDELLTDQYFQGSLGYLYQLGTLPPIIGGRIYAVGVYELARPYGVINQSRLPNDFAAGLVVRTFVGPAAIGVAIGDNGHRKLFFKVGRVF